MSMTLKPGARLFSAVGTTEMIAVKVPAGEIELTIGGLPPVASAAERSADAVAVPGHDGGAAMGKRYVDDAETIELLCTKPGAAVPALNGQLLQLKEAKALPASD
jgi:hypothetical protein